MTTELHGKCTPSQLALRLHCPGSVNLENTLPDVRYIDTPAAAEGRKKHRQAELLRKGDISIDHMELTEDVRWAVNQAQEIIGTLPPDNLLIMDEYKIDLSNLGIVAGMEGCRLDLLAVIPGSYALIADYKFGVGFVDSPEWNWQMRGYAVGVWRLFGVQDVELVIISPNAIDEKYRLKRHVLRGTDLQEAEQKISDIVARASAPDAPLIRGDHCTENFCKCLTACPLWRDTFLSIPQNTSIEAHVKLLPPADRRKLYEDLLTAGKYCEKAADAIKALVMRGEITIEGYEIADSRKTREWKDESFAKDQLAILAKAAGVAVVLVTEPISPAAAEKLFGDTVIEPMVNLKVGNPVLKRQKY